MWRSLVSSSVQNPKADPVDHFEVLLWLPLKIAFDILNFNWL